MERSKIIAVIDECAAGTHDCDVNAVCTDTDESYLCSCKVRGEKGKEIKDQYRLDSSTNPRILDSSPVVSALLVSYSFT